MSVGYKIPRGGIKPALGRKTDGPYLLCGPYSRYLTVAERVALFFGKKPALPDDPNVLRWGEEPTHDHD